MTDSPPPDDAPVEPGAAGNAPARTTAGAGRTPGHYGIAMQPGTHTPVGGYGPGPRRQPMAGFEETYVDIVDYIVRITDRIWEDQDVGYIYDTYTDACRIVDDSGPRYGIEPVVEATLQSLASFPDVRHVADDVIWAGNEAAGFATSHRAMSIGHHTGPWQWGPPTGRKVETWVIANCVSRENRIFEEWIIYNTGARLQQIGINVWDAARRVAAEVTPNPVPDEEPVWIERLVNGRAPLPEPSQDPREDFDVERFVRALFHNVYNRRDLSAVDRAYRPAVRWHGTTNRLGTSRAEVKAMARALLGTFPDLGLAVDEVYWMGDEAHGYAVSVRWSGAGTHRGWGLYGRPTNRRVRLWGLSQLYIRDRQVHEDWSLFNEFDVLVQLSRSRTDAPSTDRPQLA